MKHDLEFVGKWLNRTDLDRDVFDNGIYPMGKALAQSAYMGGRANWGAEGVHLCGLLAVGARYFQMESDSEFYLKLLRVMTQGFGENS